MAQEPLGCVETDGVRSCTELAFVLDENGGAQVWCGINVTPVSQSCRSWVPVTQRISMPRSVLEVRCDVGFHDGSHTQQELDIAVGQACHH